ncbi:RecD-like DNA helicase Atu2026 [Nonlabens tegetincola]|uniref:RecD-like DNA helicase Atu2026 n=1 Tax=Nonlabens tegetincola TaxID=323273 RepID=A0A090Q780_9FLAO|nr:MULTISPECIES: AAA family ATPase [Nonlabens]ALM22026.1 ATP-dependent endonuclease [Nonlabens sp. MIC269]ARN71276.1 ATP-dependent endonuclease [Nonlabens tegetincola]GAK97618.1 RecD-like DNA helicase Atu2026 [Nonlabens tegetincola]
MDVSSFYKELKDQFPFEPTNQQDIALHQLSDFILDKKNKDRTFLLKGYAGTGKTTLISVLVKAIWKVRVGTVLLAPTGRAAKVISNYSSRQAATIHREIYYPKGQGSGSVEFTLKKNKHRNTLFIVDEASMIPDVVSEGKLFGATGSLLDDLIQYVYEGSNCKLLIIGDTAQLPPVKLEVSPALDERIIEQRYLKEVTSIELDEVKRQTDKSGILYNATGIRNHIEEQDYNFKFNVQPYNDIKRLIDGHEIIDTINSAYDINGHEETAIIVRSNKRANLYNQQIRSRILFRESELSAGDFLMVVKNNYHWLKPTSDAGFIANGDIIEILEIFSFKELYGFKFANVKVRMVDYPDMKPFETTLLLDTLTSESPSLTYEQSNKLYQEVRMDYLKLPKWKQYKEIKANQYFNALQVKFSYAITCHKSQGGQWENVIVEQPYLPDGPSKDYLRWLYTACTRAKTNLYLIGFNKDHFIES